MHLAVANSPGAHVEITHSRELISARLGNSQVDGPAAVQTKQTASWRQKQEQSEVKEEKTSAKQYVLEGNSTFQTTGRHILAIKRLINKYPYSQGANFKLEKASCRHWDAGEENNGRSCCDCWSFSMKELSHLALHRHSSLAVKERSSPNPRAQAPALALNHSI